MMYELLGYCSNHAHFCEYLYNRENLSALTADLLKEIFEPKKLTNWPFWKHVGSWQALADQSRKASQTVGIMRYRKDGWVSISPKKKQGVLVTKTLSAGKTLAINARAENGANIRVEVLDASNKPIPEYSGDKATIFRGDSTDFLLSWDNGTLKSLPPFPIRLRITIVGGDVFALYW